MDETTKDEEARQTADNIIRHLRDNDRDSAKVSGHCIHCHDWETLHGEQVSDGLADRTQVILDAELGTGHFVMPSVLAKRMKAYDDERRRKRMSCLLAALLYVVVPSAVGYWAFVSGEAKRKTSSAGPSGR